MSKMTLKHISEKMRSIDFAMLLTHAADGAIAARPMSNNGDVEFDGDSFFFSFDDAHSIEDIERNAAVTLTYAGAAGLLGKPPCFISVTGQATLIRDIKVFEKHWTKSLDRWFKDGPRTVGIVLIAVHADRVHYWDGEDSGEVTV